MQTNATVTIYHKDYVAKEKSFNYKRIVVKASWYSDHRIAVDSTGIIGSETYNVRIPLEELGGYMAPDEYNEAGQPANKWTVANGDYFKRGTGEDITSPKELTGTFAQVNAWSDNRRGMLKHIRITGW
jgi:hypothetical protein